MIPHGKTFVTFDFGNLVLYKVKLKIRNCLAIKQSEN